MKLEYLKNLDITYKRMYGYIIGIIIGLFISLISGLENIETQCTPSQEHTEIMSGINDIKQAFCNGDKRRLDYETYKEKEVCDEYITEIPPAYCKNVWYEKEME